MAFDFSASVFSNILLASFASIFVLGCFGCGEMMTSDGNVELTCDIWDSKIFEELLNPYHKLRPEAE